MQSWPILYTAATVWFALCLCLKLCLSVSMSTAPVYFMPSYLECLEDKHPLQSRVRASGLQGHRRITLNFSDWLWAVLWGDWVSLYLPVCLFPSSTPLGAAGPWIPGYQFVAALAVPPVHHQGRCWCSTAEGRQPDRHSVAPALAPCSSQIFPQAPQVWILAWSCGARSVWQRGCKSGAVLQWVMQHWCGVTGWGLRFGSREGGRARKGGSAEVTTETWYPWILAILTYFWVFTLCCWQKRSKMEGLKLWGEKKGSFHNFPGSRLFVIMFS